MVLASTLLEPSIVKHDGRGTRCQRDCIGRCISFARGKAFVLNPESRASSNANLVKHSWKNIPMKPNEWSYIAIEREDAKKEKIEQGCAREECNLPPASTPQIFAHRLQLVQEIVSA